MQFVVNIFHLVLLFFNAAIRTYVIIANFAIDAIFT